MLPTQRCAKFLRRLTRGCYYLCFTGEETESKITAQGPGEGQGVTQAARPHARQLLPRGGLFFSPQRVKAQLPTSLAWGTLRP